MINKKRSIISLLLVSFLFSGNIYNTNAEETFDIKYIKKDVSKPIYTFYSKDFGDDPSKLKMFINGKEITGYNKTMKNEGIEIGDILKTAGEINFEKTYSVTDGSGQVSKKTIKSNTIKFKTEDITYLSNETFIEYRAGRDMVNIFFENGFSNWINGYSSGSLEKSVFLNVNGKEFELTKDPGVSYEEGKYYYNNKYITFPIKNLSEIQNIIKLSFDKSNSNSITLNKTKYLLEKPLEYEISDLNNSKIIKFKFTQPKGFNDLNGYEVYVNDVKIDSKDATIGLGFLTVSIDISKINSTQKAIKIYIKDLANNYYTNKLPINIEKIVENRIENIDLGSGDGSYGNIKIKGSMNAFIGDIYKMIININGKEYTKLGTKETYKDNSGAILKDIFGNEKYYFKNKIDFFVNGGNTINFDLEYSTLTGGENVIFIKNNTTGRESNKISFFKGDYKKINYDTGIIQTNTGKENIVFENGSDIVNKKIDYINKGENEFIFGKINFNNFKENDMYDVTFRIDTNTRINPFNDFKLDKSFEVVKQNNGNISFIFNQINTGKEFKTGNISASINEFFNLKENSITLNLGNFSIKKYERDGNINEIFNNKNTTLINFGYKYAFGNCFDGEKDYCGIEGIADPSLIVSIGFGKDISILDTQSEVIKSPNEESSIIFNTKKNSAIITYEYKNSKYKTLNEKFIKFYDKLKLKSFTTRQLTTLKNAINNILKGLKDIDDNKSKIEANYIIKTNLKNIVTIINSLGK